MNCSEIPVEKLLPHAGNMVLIDQLTDVSENAASAIVNVRNNGVFCGNQDVVPAWVGIEYMAQAIAAWAGWHAHVENRPVKLGFLLGTRRYTSNVSQFHCGDILQVNVERNFGAEHGLGSFQCRITGITKNGEPVSIESTLNVFQPDEKQVKTLLEEKQ